jgi:hypothetical protein
VTSPIATTLVTAPVIGRIYEDVGSFDDRVEDA